MRRRVCIRLINRNISKQSLSTSVVAPNYAELHRRSVEPEQRQEFWRQQASLIDWQTPFSDVLQVNETNKAFKKWFVGGKTNLRFVGSVKCKRLKLISFGQLQRNRSTRQCWFER